MSSAPARERDLVVPPPLGGKFTRFMRELDHQQAFAYLAAALVPVLAFALVYFTQIKPFSRGEIGDLRLYGVAAPTLLAAGVCLVLGVLSLLVRAPWTVTGCAIGMLLTAGAYCLALLAVDGIFPTGPLSVGYLLAVAKAFPKDALSLGYLVTVFLCVLAYPSALGRSKSAKPAEIPLTITKVGNISYSTFGLLMLFGWLLWFDFCFWMMEGVMGAVLSFRLVNELKTPNIWLGIMMGSIPTLLGFFLTPIISVKSDRHRGPRGRRVPFLLWASPFVCALLALIGFANDIGAWAHADMLPYLARTLPAWTGAAGLTAISPDTTIIWTFFALNFAFFIANSFMGTVFYYLFNDVVPPGHFVKFMAYMRVVSGVAGILYMACIFEYSNKSGPVDINLGFWSYSAENIWYPKLILIGAAVFYMAAGMITFFKMREPDYPPPPPLKVEGHNWSAVWSVVRKSRLGPMGEWIAKPVLSRFVLVPAACALLLAAIRVTSSWTTMDRLVLVMILLVLESLLLVVLLISVYQWLRRSLPGAVTHPLGIFPSLAILAGLWFVPVLDELPGAGPHLAMGAVWLLRILCFLLACAWLGGRLRPFGWLLRRLSARVAKASAGVLSFGMECLCHRFYILIFAWMTIGGLTDAMSGWKNPLRISVGIDTQTLGKLGAATGTVSLILTLLTANVGDRFRPLPLMVVVAVMVVLTAPIGVLYLVPGLPPNWYLGIEIAYVLTHIPIGIVGGIAGGPLLMELFPRDRFGQFSAGGSVIRNTLCGVFAAAFVGWLMDRLKELHGGGDYFLRYAFTWQILFQVLGFIMLYLMYREWKRLGGRKSFKPPPVGHE